MSKYTKLYLKSNIHKAYTKFALKALNRLQSEINANPNIFGKKLITQSISETEFDVLFDGEIIASYWAVFDNNYKDKWCIQARVYNLQHTHNTSTFYSLYVCDWIKFPFVTYYKICHYGECDCSGIVNTLKRKVFTEMALKAKILSEESIEKLIVSLDDIGGNFKDGYSLTISSKIDFEKFDCRFFSIDGHKPKGINNYGIMCKSVTFPSDKPLTIKDIADVIVEISNEFGATFKSCYDKYDEVKEISGGCIVYLDAYMYLAHKDMQPIANSSFLTMKCPYTNDILTMNITNVSQIRIQGMDEFHNSTQMPVLLG